MESTLAVIAAPHSEDVPIVARAAYRSGGWFAMGHDAASAEERTLVEAAQQGDQAALRELLDRFARPLHAAVILPRVGNTADGDEVLRDALSRAVERLSTYRWTGAGFYPWLRQIAMNLIIDRGRRIQRRRRTLGELEHHEAAVQPLHHAGAEEMLIEQQERTVAMRMLDRALCQLSERHRRAIELRLMEEKSREECAEALGVSMGNFDVIFHRALVALRKAYGVR